MRILLFAIVSLIFFNSCSNNSGTQNAVFCDTLCKQDSFNFKGDSRFVPTVKIGMTNCKPDTLSWGHYLLDFDKTIHVPSFLGQDVTLNASALDCYIKDTSYAWLTFNDCKTGRGYLLKLPFSKNGTIGKYTGALNDFDPKYSIEKDLRAYTDRGSIFVVDIITGKEAAMSFKEAYDIDFNKLHDVVDSVNVTKKRIYVKLLKAGKEIPIEKSIEL